MTRKVPKIKGIHDNSRIIAIGNIFRLKDGSEWMIKIQLDPDQKKQSLGISQLPLLARRRVLNATEEPRVAGYEMKLTLHDVGLKAVKIKDCPLPSVSKQRDKNQWCFCFQQGAIEVYLPQLELARALFLYEPYLCRLAMAPGGIAEEFDVQQRGESDSIQIGLLKSCSLPKHMRANHELRRALAWLILDPQIRSAFESISRYQLIEGEEKDRYRVWQFRFDPPPLDQVTVTVRGHYDQARSTIFVYEIYRIDGLPSNHHNKVLFLDPEYRESVPGAGKGTSAARASYSEPEIDDDVPPLAEAREVVLEGPKIVRSYIDPAHTTRRGIGKRGGNGGRKEADIDDVENSEPIVASTDEGSRKGHVFSGAIDTVNDQSDDIRNYASRFHEFSRMIEVLQVKGCKKDYFELRKLPPVSGHSKHLLDDGNPRLWAVVLLRRNGVQFGLMEVDTFSSRKQMSTLLVKGPSTSFNWNRCLAEIERRVVCESLRWPTEYLDAAFCMGEVQRIPHPQTFSGNKDLLETDVIEHWAERISARMQ